MTAIWLDHPSFKLCRGEGSSLDGHCVKSRRAEYLAESLIKSWNLRNSVVLADEDKLRAVERLLQHRYSVARECAVSEGQLVPIFDNSFRQIRFLRLH